VSLLGSRRVTDLAVQIPPAGGWVATGHLDSGKPPDPGPATLTIGDLSLSGVVQAGRGGLDAPDRPAFLLAGGAGWRTLLPAPGGAYASPSGVRLSTVLADLARACGEAYDAPPEALLGPSYGWDAGTPADAVLADLIARGAIPTWRVLPSGRTSFTPWPSLPAADSRGTVEDRELVRGARSVALTTWVAAWLPGATVQADTIVRTIFKEDGEQLRATVFGSSDLGPLDRLRRIVVKILPQLARLIIDPATGNLAIRAADGRIDLAGGGPAVLRVPDVARLVLDPGIPGTYTPALYLTRDGGSTFLPVAMVAPGSTQAGTVPPLPGTPSTALAPSGSGKVTSG
jgi:hypothetical protein